MTLYLKYRPRTIDELDLASVRDSLTKVIASNNLPHAFLFSGPKGAGKTSAARILAKVVNCEKNREKLTEPCNKCDQCTAITNGSHIDVVEMDAASNRGIDDIRALRDSVLLAPSMGRKRIYIIDEAHMLTSEASNAFLKTLEEPPAHVLFIFATTEAHRLPATVRSRLYNVPFTRATDEEIVRQLQRVAKGENVKVEVGLLMTIAQVSDGSFREAVKIFEELVMVQGVKTESEAKEYLANNLKGSPTDFLKLLVDRDLQSALSMIEQIVTNGGDVALFIEELVGLLRGSMLARAGVVGHEILDFVGEGDEVEILEMLLAVTSRTNRTRYPQLPLQIAIVKWSTPSTQSGTGGQGGFQDDKVIVRESPLHEASVDHSKQSLSVPVKKKVQKPLDNASWIQILEKTRERDMKIEALLRSAKLMGVDNGEIQVGVFYQFHKERLEVVQNRKLLDEICSDILGTPLKISYVLQDRETSPSEPVDLPLTPATPQDIINAAEEIFG